MLKRIIAWSIQHASAVIVMAALAMLGAGLVLADMPVDVFPELNAPTVVIMTEAGGLGAEEVEQQVSTRIEAGVGGLPGIRRVRSASALGLSIVWAEFDWGFDVFRARQLVSEKLSAVREDLPEGTHAEIGPVSSITGEIMLISLTSPDGRSSPAELRALGEYDVRSTLLSVPGISQVVAIGGELPELAVLARQDDLLLSGLTLADLAAATSGAHGDTSAGFLPNVAGEEQPVAQQSRLRTPADIRATPILGREGEPMPISAVATVAVAGAPPRGTAADKGVPAVVLSIQKAPGTNTLALTAALDVALDGIENTLPPGVVLNRFGFRQADFIQRSVDNLKTVLRDAMIAVAIVLILFLLNVRTTLITLTALPLSLGLALFVLWALGLTINVMTLGGLAVAIGELVDDAIIDVENVVRRLGENRALPEAQRRSPMRVIYDASNEIRSSVVFATVIIAVVFVPMLFLEGIEGRFFRPLGIAYMASILASLVVALTVTPALARLLLSRAGHQAERDGLLVRLLKRAYCPTLALALRLRKTLLVGTALMAAATVWLASTFGSSFLPEFNEGTFTVFLMAPAGTSLSESNSIARAAEKQLAKISGVANVMRRTGRAERDEHAEPVFTSEVEVTVAPGVDKLGVRREIDAVLATVKGISTTIGQPIEHRISHILSGTPAAIAISVYGTELTRLRAIAVELEGALKAMPEVRDVAANREVQVPGLVIAYRNADLARLGLSRATAAAQVGAALSGTHVARVLDGLRIVDVTVRLAADERRDLTDVQNLVLRGAQGQLVRLLEVADVHPDQFPYTIAREGGRRKAIVSCNVSEGYDLGSVVAAVQRTVDPIVARSGMTVHYGGQFEAQTSARSRLAVTGGLIFLLVLMLLRSALGSLSAAGLVLVNLPLAIIGGILAVYLTVDAPWQNTLALLGVGGRYVPPVLSVASLVGFITLFGIAVRNGILLVNHYAWLQEKEGCTVTEAVLRGSIERLVPILMTALTAVLGLVPLAWAAGEPGSELLAPIAVVVLGGLVSSTFLNLLVVPAGYLLVFGRKGFRRAKTEDLEAVATAA